MQANELPHPFTGYACACACGMHIEGELRSRRSFVLSDWNVEATNGE
jgi:hypothetical protein